MATEISIKKAIDRFCDSVHSLAEVMKDTEKDFEIVKDKEEEMELSEARDECTSAARAVSMSSSVFAKSRSGALNVLSPAYSAGGLQAYPE